MRRYAILLGHADGELSTKIDLSRVKNFLLSNRGGAWYDTEIHCEQNISNYRLSVLLEQIRSAGYDYVFFYFSGHGGYERSTVLELNPTGETISEQFVSGLASRQLNIYDCCRSFPNMISEEAGTEGLFSMRESSSRIRRLYEERIMSTSPQQMSLYSCSVGECSYDFGNGGIYTTHLLEATKHFFGDFLLASQAHSYAYQPTIDEAAIHRKTQTPDYFMAKLMARQQLILAINDSHTRC